MRTFVFFILSVSFFTTISAFLLPSSLISMQSSSLSKQFVSQSQSKSIINSPSLSTNMPNMKLYASSDVGEEKNKATEESKGEEETPEWKGAQFVSAKTSDVKKVFDVEHIASVLPHRYPFLLVDKVVEYEAGKRAVGIKSISMNEPQFTGHFPERPIMPGVLMVEAMAQLGGVVALQMEGLEGKLFFFAGIDGVKFKRPVVPGDTLVMEMEMTKYLAKFGIAKFTGKAYVDGQVAVEVAEFTFAVQK